jgi:predicted nicotinamide N-methyase
MTAEPAAHAKACAARLRLVLYGMSRPADFIRSNARLMPVPLVPEISLHLAEESMPIWQKTEEELGRMNVAPPYWAFAWAGGQALARYTLDNPTLVADRAVLDLGAGSGLASIAAMKAGARSVLAADVDAYALVAVALNAAANGVKVETTGQDLLTAALGAFAAIMVGDMFYERELAERTLAFIEAARAKGAEVLVGDPRRSYFPKARFRAVAEYSVPVTRDLEDMEIKHTAVWRLV